MLKSFPVSLFDSFDVEVLDSVFANLVVVIFITNLMLLAKLGVVLETGKSSGATAEE